MLKTKLLTLFLSLTIYSTSHSQLFVNPSNEWYLEDCCTDGPNPNYCNTYKYSFGELVSIGILEYRPLITNSPNPLFFEIGALYRELDGQVFMKLSVNEDEVLIYDFNLQIGETLTFGLDIAAFNMEVITIDSITLNSGEKRKRLELGMTPGLEPRTFWIEGIGGDLSTMNPEYMFTFDCWSELNCFHQDSIVEYAPGDCQLTTGTKDLLLTDSDIQVYPNPVSNLLNIEASGNRKISKIEVLDVSGKSYVLIHEPDVQSINVRALINGMYLIKLSFEDGKVGVSMFIKS